MCGEFYLCYCEGGFRERAISTVQVLLPNPAVSPGCLVARLLEHADALVSVDCPASGVSAGMVAAAKSPEMPAGSM